MSSMQLVMISRCLLIAGMLLLMFSGVLYVKLDLYRAWHIITGRQLKERGVRLKEPGNKRQEVSYAAKKYIRVMTSQKQDITVQLDRTKTELPEQNQVLETVMLGDVQLKYDVTYVHTKIRI